MMLSFSQMMKMEKTELGKITIFDLDLARSLKVI